MSSKTSQKQERLQIKNRKESNSKKHMEIVVPIKTTSYVEQHLIENQFVYAKSLSNRLQINSKGSELIGLIGNGLEGENLTAIKHWLLNKSKLIERKLDHPSNILEILSIQLRCDIYDALENSLSA